MSAALWKGIALALVVLLLAAGAGGGFEWWTAAHDRDLARAQLKAEQETTSLLRSAVDTQNAAVDALAAAKALADQKRAAAQALADANGKRYATAAAALAQAKAGATCDEAMPAIDKLLESVR